MDLKSVLSDGAFQKMKTQHRHSFLPETSLGIECCALFLRDQPPGYLGCSEIGIYKCVCSFHLAKIGCRSREF